MTPDFWSSDFQKAQNLLKAVEEELGEASVRKKSLSGREIALTRGRLSQLSALVTHMQQSVSRDSETGSHVSNSSVELEKRSSALLKLSRDIEQCERRFYASMSSGDERDVEAQASSGASTRDEEQVMMQERSSQLDHILGTATNLKEIGYEINDEIGVHVRLLEEIESREDEIFSKQKANDRQLKDWMNSKNASVAWLWGIVVFLFFTFIYVLMW